MIDLHCHIIPWADDGAKDAHTACGMARHALKNGVEVIVATPHCNLRGMQNNFRGQDYEYRLGMFRSLLRQHHIPLELLPGAELFAHPSNLRQILDERRAVTLNRSRYLLVEFDFGSPGSDISDALDLIARKNLIPVVAHPERYRAVQDEPTLPRRWSRQGYVLQINKGSILGQLGEGSRDAAMQMLHAQIAHVIASDAHDTHYRTTGFLSLLPVLEKVCPSDYISLLLRDNPESILLDGRVCAP